MKAFHKILFHLYYFGKRLMFNVYCIRFYPPNILLTYAKYKTKYDKSFWLLGASEPRLSTESYLPFCMIFFIVG